MLYIPRQLRTLELGYMFQSGSGLSNFAARSNANQDLRTLPYVQLCHIAIQDSRTLLHVSMQSGPSNFAIPFECRPELSIRHTFQCSSGHSNLAAHFNAVQDHRTLLYGPMQFRTVELSYMFQCSLGFSDFAIGSASLYFSSGLSNFAARFIAVHDLQSLLCVPMRFRDSRTLP